jgi:hypothetical protein
MRMPFGKYQGRDLEEIPKDYLNWIAEHIDLYGPLREAVFDVLVGKEGELWEPPPRRNRNRR